MSVILGPCPCQGCGAMVRWDGIAWNDPTGKHSCHAPKERFCRRNNCDLRADWPSLSLCAPHFREWARKAA